MDWESSGGSTGSVIGARRRPGQPATCPRTRACASPARATPSTPSRPSPPRRTGRPTSSSAYNWGLALTPVAGPDPDGGHRLRPRLVQLHRERQPRVGDRPGRHHRSRRPRRRPATGARSTPTGTSTTSPVRSPTCSPVLIKDIGGTSCSTISALHQRHRRSGDADMTGARIYTRRRHLDRGRLGSGPRPQLDPARHRHGDHRSCPSRSSTCRRTRRSSVTTVTAWPCPATPSTTRSRSPTGASRPIDDLTLTDERPEHVTYVPGTTPPTATPSPMTRHGHALPARRGRDRCCPRPSTSARPAS